MLRTTKQNADYLAGIYARVSKEDERHGESLSIENQLIIIRNYIKESGFSEVKIYIDDEMTGKGTRNFADGNKYQGDFVDGKYHGEGTYLG